MPNRWSPRGPILGGCLLIIIILGICFVWCRWWRCPFCPTCPPSAPQAAAKIVLEDMHSAVWAPLDNGWVHDVASNFECPDIHPDCSFDTSTFRNGVMFQLGDVIDEEGNLQEHYGGVRLRLDDGTTKELHASDFEWLDVRAAGSNCPIDALHAYSLFKRDRDDDDVVKVQCDAAVLTDASLPLSCLRQRALHASFKPNKGVITYWTGASYFKVVAGAGDGDEHDLTYTFDLMDDVTVDLWKQGCFVRSYDNVAEIRILYVDPDSDHGGYHDPVMDGGTICKRPCL